MTGADISLQLYSPLRLEKAQQGWHAKDDEDLNPKPFFLDRVRHAVGNVKDADVDGCMTFLFE